MDLYAQSEQYPGGWIKGYRSRLPRDASLADFFQNFVRDYNHENRNFPITNLQEDEHRNPLGWNFYFKRAQRGRKWIVDPYKTAYGQIQEGDLILARRVILGEVYQPDEKPPFLVDKKPKPKDDEEDIIFTEVR